MTLVTLRKMKGDIYPDWTRAAHNVEYCHKGKPCIILYNTKRVDIKDIIKTITHETLHHVLDKIDEGEANIFLNSLDVSIWLELDEVLHIKLKEALPRWTDGSDKEIQKLLMKL